MEVTRNCWEMVDDLKMPAKSVTGRTLNLVSHLDLHKKSWHYWHFSRRFSRPLFCKWFEKATKLPLSVIHTSCSRDYLQPLVKIEYSPLISQQDWRHSCLENVLVAVSGYLGEYWRGKRSCHMLLGWNHLCAPDRRSTWDQIHPPSSPCPLAYVENNILWQEINANTESIGL